MGNCGASAAKPVSDKQPQPNSSSSDESKNGYSYKQIINERCPHIRLDHCESIKEFPVIDGNSYKYKMRYCYVSQRGYYPNALGKANQDSYLICESLLKDPNCNLFGIFDGHGEYGDYCSHYAADQVPQYLEKELKANGGLSALDGPKFEDVYTKAFVKANKAMHRSNIDDTLSGTTGITIIIKGDILMVANVGDSRAIIATEVDGKLRYAPLSNDQTPFRKDERERLKKKGARIMTLEQIEGNEPIHENWGAESGDEIDEVGDPPRVWDSTLERPGSAFTRSLGDSVAEAVGVYAEPEILVWNLSPNDKFAVIASDGVFEFLTSQAVVDIISKFASPLDAAKHVVAEAYRLWLTFDDRTDDITIIIINFDEVTQKSNIVTAVHDKRSAKVAAMETVESKPVRRVMSKAKRKVISENWDNDDKAEPYDFAANATTKTPEELSRIGDMVKANFMFQHLSPVQKDQIFQVMALKHVTTGQMIIKEGDEGDEMYIIDSGEFTVHKKDENGVSQTVFTYTSAGAAFGELSLMYGKPRAASIKAKTDGKLWSIGRQAFRAVLMKKKQDGLLKLLTGVPIFHSLALPQLQRLCELTNEESYAPKDVVFSSGKPNHWIMCIVMEGALKLLPTDESKKKQTRENPSYVVSAELNAHFKEIVAEGKTRLACIPEEVFIEIVGKEAVQQLAASVAQGVKSKRMSIIRKVSIFSNPDRIALKSLTSRSDFELDSPLILLGEFGYIGNFKKKNDMPCSLKVISKQKAVDNRMERRIVSERIFLAALQQSNNASSCLPKIAGVYKDAKVAILVYDEYFVCDLALAISQSVIANESKPFYAACIYSAICSLHENGLMHRFLNPGSVYITNNGVAKVADLRYAKRMDGSKAFTICGDPLYFGPEIVGQRGYDYASDLWAYGVLLFELYEGNAPFGTVDTEETQVFRAINSFKDGQLKFTEKTSEAAKSLISKLVRPDPESRIGFKSGKDIKLHNLFNQISMETIGTTKGHPIDIQASVDLSSIFVETELDDNTSTEFDQF